MSSQTADNSWRFERQITLGVVIAIALQTAGALVWAGSTGERLTQLESSAQAGEPVNERLARLETQVVHMRATLDRIERRLDQTDN